MPFLAILREASNGTPNDVTRTVVFGNSALRGLLRTSTNSEISEQKGFEVSLNAYCGNRRLRMLGPHQNYLE